MDPATKPPTAALRLDRLAERALIVAAGLHLVAFAVFLAALTAAGAALGGQATACAGDNLLARLRHDDPARHAAVLAEADAVDNGRAILWRVERPGTAPSVLFGTMHSADPRVTAMPPAARAALEAAVTVIVESTEALDRDAMAAATVALKQHTFLADGTTLEAMVAADEVGPLKAAVEARGMPWTLARHMQPWMIAAAISIPVCEVEAKAAGMPVLDSLIATRAAQAGKRLVGLETIEEQFLAIASIPREFHVSALAETLKLGTLTDAMMETTKQLYLDGNTALLIPLIRAYAPATYDGSGYAEFQERLIAGRNRTMAVRAARHLEEGAAFMAVGALHLPGENGLVALLRRAGFTVEPVAR